MDSLLLTLIELQAFDTRLAMLEAEAARLPAQIEAIHAALASAKKALDALKTKVDTTKKELRTKEKDLEVVTAKRQKSETRLWEVKNNTEGDPGPHGAPGEARRGRPGGRGAIQAA